MEALKPCPFCKSTDIKDYYVFMRCGKCGARGPAMNDGDYNEHADYIDRQNAIAAWNKRT
jgi:hypothetical protein